MIPDILGTQFFRDNAMQMVVQALPREKRAENHCSWFFPPNSCKIVAKESQNKGNSGVDRFSMQHNWGKQQVEQMKICGVVFMVEWFLYRNFASRMLTQPCDSLSSCVFREPFAQAAPFGDAQIRGFLQTKTHFLRGYPSWQNISWTSPTSWNCWQIISAIDGKAIL